MAQTSDLTFPLPPRGETPRPAFRGFQGFIGPRRFSAAPDPNLRQVPRGEQPANPHRPVLAALSLAIFVFALWVQVGRYQECRAEGFDVGYCLVDR